MRILKTMLCCASISLAQAGGDFNVKINDESNNPQIKQIYVIAKGVNPDTGKEVFINFTDPNKVGDYVELTKDTDSRTYSYDARMFKDTGLHLPYLKAGRVYLSINNKLSMPIVGDNVLGISEPDPFNPTNPNSATLYDKVEFTYKDNHETVINPTAVDFISLPIAIQQAGVTYGLEGDRERVMQNIAQQLSDAKVSSEWQRLITKDDDGNILRVLAAGRNSSFFAADYLDATDNYNYINDIFEYYKTHTLTIDVRELIGNDDANTPKLSDWIFTGQVNANGDFVFNNQGHEHEVVLTRKQKAAAPSLSNQFFLASQGTFEATNNTPRAVIVRELTAAWSVGLLPVAEDVTLNKTFFNAMRCQNMFYLPNIYLQAESQNKGPWYNLYAKAIHDNSQNLYAWPYDDELGLDGTNTSTDANPATLTLQNMSSTAVK